MPLPRLVNALALVASLALVSTMVLRTTDAAFSEKTANSANSFTFEDITLVDNDTSSAMFTVVDMVPGNVVTKCIRVTYGGDVAVDVNLYATSITDTSSVATHLDMTIEEGTDSSAAAGDLNCDTFTPDGAAAFTGTLATFGGKLTHTAGVGAWAPTTSGTKDYRIIVTLGTDTPNTAQGAAVTAVEFTWEAITIPL